MQWQELPGDTRIVAGELGQQREPGVVVDIPRQAGCDVVALVRDVVDGGSLLLIPVACGLFGISSDIAMQVVAIGMMISVLQDSTETALNSSTDVLFTTAADRGFD